MPPASGTSLGALERYRAEFPIFNEVAYLNTCSLGALGRRSRARLDQFLQQWDERGAANWYDVWWSALDELRAGYAHVIGASAREVALHASISTATSVVASALDYTERRRIVTTALDFPTVPYQWLARQPELEVTIVPSRDGVSIALDDIAGAVDERTALVATSHVYFTTGAIQDVATVAEIAHRCGALCYIDAYQSVGQMPISIHELGVDFLTAGGLKWLLGGPGIGFLYVRADLASSLEPVATGWFAHERQFAFDPARLERHADARRFEQGTPALAAVHTQLGGLDLLRDIGLESVWAATRHLTDDLIARLDDIGRPPLTRRHRGTRSAIVMVPDSDPRATVQQLAQRGVIADARPGHVRLSPFFYNIADDHVRAIEVLRT